MTFIIDRFEGEFAVVEAQGKVYNIPKALLPEGAKEGDVIATRVETQETEIRKAQAENLLNSLFDERK